MWSARVSRREFIELYLGSTKVVEGRAREASVVDVAAKTDVILVWGSDPSIYFTLPAVVIAAEADLQGLLTAVVAAPQAPSPVTALTHVLSDAEAAQIFDSDVLPLSEKAFPAFASLVYVEAVLHGSGRLGLRQLTPMICRRTMSYSWAKAVCARIPAESFVELPARWLETYAILNSGPAFESAQRAADSVISGLNLLTQLAMGLSPEGAAGRLAYELLHGNKISQDDAWEDLAARLPRPVSIDVLQSLAREERGAYLQDALRLLGGPGSRGEHDALAAACAFLATRLAPGSLEHMDILKSAASPEVLGWYAIYAALQHPKEILSLYGGLGLRLVRDLIRSEEKLEPPTADISYLELKILARGGLDSLSSKTAHASELQVEVVPYVSSTFTYQLRQKTRSGDPQYAFDVEATEPPISPRARASRLAAELAQLARDLPDFSDDYSEAKRKRR